MQRMFVKRKKVVPHLLVDSQAPLLEVRNLSIEFKEYRRGLHETRATVIKELDIVVQKGEILAVVGASGSGKTLLASAILGLLPENAFLQGNIKFKGVEITEENIESFRGQHITLIPQSINALNPLKKTGKQVNANFHQIFNRLQLSEQAGNYYPFQLSGGMARRVLAASAFASSAELIIADEPTPGLDPVALKETIHFLKELSTEGRGIILITHDIETALLIADRIAVFYGGQVVEITRASSFTGQGKELRHPYTKALWKALPQNGFIPLPGHHPLLEDNYKGCSFHQRCPVARSDCASKNPEAQLFDEEMVRCLYA